MLNLKIIFIYFLLNLYYIFQFDFIIKIIQFIGGPLFIKIFQSFNNLKRLSTYDAMDGSIGDIAIKNNIVIKSLKVDIYKKFDESFLIFKKVLHFSRIKLPFYFDDYYSINMKQLNFFNEQKNSIELKNIFENINRVEVIDIFNVSNNYHESKFINAFTIDNFLEKNKNSKYKIEIYNLLNLSYYLMLASNFFHCDWHYGNFLVNFNSKDEIILYILDVGLVGKLDNIDHHNKLKTLLRTNMLKPEPINIIKFLSYVNLNKNADVKKFIEESKFVVNNFNKYKDIKNYKLTLLKLIDNASKNELKFPIVIFYMFQAIIFLNNHDEIIYDRISSFSKSTGFYREIEKYLIH